MTEDRELPHPLCPRRTQWGDSRCQPGSGSHQTPHLLALWSQTSSSQTVREKLLLLISHPDYSVFVTTAWGGSNKGIWPNERNQGETQGSWAGCQSLSPESLDCMHIELVNPKGDLSWIFIGRTDAEAETPLLLPPVGRTDKLETTLMLGKIEGRRRKGDRG